MIFINTDFTYIFNMNFQHSLFPCAACSDSCGPEWTLGAATCRSMQSLSLVPQSYPDVGDVDQLTQIGYNNIIMELIIGSAYHVCHVPHRDFFESSMRPPKPGPMGSSRPTVMSYNSQAAPRAARTQFINAFRDCMSFNPIHAGQSMPLLYYS